MNEPVSTARRSRNRTMFVLIVVIFLGSALIAGALRLSGWQPEGSRAHGELFDPPVDARALVPRLQDGGDYPWEPDERIWRVVVVPPAGCSAPCAELSAISTWCGACSAATPTACTRCGRARRRKAWCATARCAWSNPIRAARRAAARGRPAGVPVYVIDPNGFVILRYAPVRSGRPA